MRLHLPHRHDDVALITDAAPSQDRQWAYRRRRYTITMLVRVVFFVAAAVSYQVPWLAITFAGLALVLPWVAVIMANDRLPKKTERRHHFDGRVDRELPPSRTDGTRTVDH